MRILTHTVTAAEDGQTAKQLLRGLWHISGSLLSRLKFRDAITANGVPVPVNHILRTGDVLGADVSDLPGEHPHILPVDYPSPSSMRTRISCCWISPPASPSTPPH